MGHERLFLTLGLSLLIAGCSITKGFNTTRAVPSEGNALLYSYVKVPIIVSPLDIPSRILIECTIDNIEHVLLKLDTAAPKSSLAPQSFLALGLSQGEHDIWIGDKGRGVHIGKKQISSIKASKVGPIEGPGIPSGSILRGTVGTDWLQGYAAGIDFASGAIWLMQRSGSDSLEVSRIPLPSNVRTAGISVAAELKSADSSEGGVLFVDASFEDQGNVGSFLVDTGANTNLALSSYWTSIHSGSPRSVPLDLADYQGSVISGAYWLGSAYTLGGQKISKQVPVWVLDKFPVLDYSAIHFQHQFQGLIGLWGLFQNYTVLDYGVSNSSTNKTNRIFLFPYQKTASLEDRYFTGFGLTVRRADNVVKVAKGSDAETKGVQDGDLLISISGAPYQIAATGIVMGSNGEIRTFQMRRGNSNYSVNLTAENLLRP